jgi:hypothetical protein
MTMPTINPEITHGHILQAIVVLTGAAIVWGSHQHETRELRTWLIRHEASIQRHTEQIAKHDIAGAESVLDRQNLRDAVNEIKRGQDQILQHIRKQ